MHVLPAVHGIMYNVVQDDVSERGLHVAEDAPPGQRRDSHRLVRALERLQVGVQPVVRLFPGWGGEPNT